MRNAMIITAQNCLICRGGNYIDPAGATENLFVASGSRKVWVLLPANGSYKIRPDGLIIIVK